MVDGHPMEANVSVSPDIEELLLGSDWLIRNQCHWNFAAGTIKMGDLELKTHRRSSVDTSHRVVVAERCVVPPRHEANVAVKVIKVEAERAEPVDWAVEPRELTPGVVAARTLLSNCTCVLARVLTIQIRRSFWSLTVISAVQLCRRKDPVLHQILVNLDLQDTLC